MVELEEPEAPACPAAGEMVLVQCPEERYVLHRVVRLESDGFFLRGDAQAHCIGPFKQSAILGRAAKSYHRGRIRAHDRGAWRTAGLIWIHCGPLGSRLLATDWTNPELCRESAATDASYFSISPLRSSLRNLDDQDG